MSFPATLPTAILETILIRLATLFLAGANNDQAAARESAAHMLAAYKPTTEDQLLLAANIVLFSFQTLEALAQAADPDLPLTQVLRLRSGAVSLSRESKKAQLQLTQLQTPAQAETAEPRPTQSQPKVQQTGTISAAAKVKGITWAQANAERQRALRIAARLKENETPNPVIQPEPPTLHPS